MRNLLLSTILALMCVSHTPNKTFSSTSSPQYFKITVVDSKTGRGVPLVELRTTNHISFWTDSNGIIAVNEPGLIGQKVFFHISSHGYEYPKDGFGYAGKALILEPGGSAVLKIKRINIAERLYRVTGQGIYRDTVLLKEDAPVEKPVLNGLVFGQDSVFNCVYNDKLYWFWGDTSRPSYPLGHFEMSGAVSQLPQDGGLDPEIGVDLDYFVDDVGFSRPVAPLKEPGLVWLDGFFTVQDNSGKTRMVAGFARLKDLGTVLERGLMVWNDDTDTFEPLIRCGLDYLPFSNTAHAFGVQVDSRKYYYFSAPAPAAPRLRVRAEWSCVIDPNEYEVYTTLASAGGTGRFRWISYGGMARSLGGKQAAIEALKRENRDVHIYDVETGEKVLSHNGTVSYSPWRKRWFAILTQHFGESSMLGEIWYAEADTPVGPWTWGRRIITHDKYSFYNPAHHREFDKDGGKTIFVEGTYSHTFSNKPENATPRYDYNQIMYKLDLTDPRLILPQPVYRVRIAPNKVRLMLAKEIRRRNLTAGIEDIAFYAVGPDRTRDRLIPVYPGDSGELLKARPSPKSKPLFHALKDKPADDYPATPLYGPKCTGNPDAGPITCFVWHNPKSDNPADWTARPLER